MQKVMGFHVGADVGPKTGIGQVLREQLQVVRLAWDAVREGADAMRQYERAVSKGLSPRDAADRVALKFFGPHAH